jgi:hypothetical protein
LSTPPPPASSAPPIQVVLRHAPLERERTLVFFRVFLLIPHFVVLYAWGAVILLGLPVLWVAALVQGQVPDGLHRFYGAYVRYYAGVWGYGTFVSDLYPPFDGKPGYSLDIEVPAPRRQSRWSILFRFFLALPPLVLATTLVGGGAGGRNLSSFGSSGSDTSSFSTGASVSGGVLITIWIIAWFACMARARMPQGLRDLSVYCIGYGAQAWGYFFLLTPRFPNSVPVAARPLAQPPHPVRASLDDDGQRTRILVALRFPLIVPHLVWLALWGIAAFFAAIASWFATVIAGRTPAALHRFLAAYVRYATDVFAFLHLVANPYPGFVGAPGSYPFAAHIDGPQRQNRWVTGFRLILAFPAFLLYSAISGAASVATVGAWVFSLIMGRTPRGLRDLNAFSVRYGTQFWAYVLLLTDRYPYGGPTLETAEAIDPALPPPPSGWTPDGTGGVTRPPVAWEPTTGWAPPAPPPADPPPPPGVP